MRSFKPTAPVVAIEGVRAAKLQNQLVGLERSQLTIRQVTQTQHIDGFTNAVIFGEGLATHLLCRWHSGAV